MKGLGTWRVSPLLTVLHYWTHHSFSVCMLAFLHAHVPTACGGGGQPQASSQRQRLPLAWNLPPVKLDLLTTEP